MVICDACDKGFHTFCLDPPIQRIPKGTNNFPQHGALLHITFCVVSPGSACTHQLPNPPIPMCPLLLLQASGSARIALSAPTVGDVPPMAAAHGGQTDTRCASTASSCARLDASALCATKPIARSATSPWCSVTTAIAGCTMPATTSPQSCMLRWGWKADRITARPAGRQSSTRPTSSVRQYWTRYVPILCHVLLRLCALVATFS